VLGGEALSEAGLRCAASLAESTGCTVLVETFPAKMARGGGLPWFKSVPYFPERARVAFGGAHAVVTVGAADPV
jgi:acetolactate synthase-1/2/3 large subunit